MKAKAYRGKPKGAKEMAVLIDRELVQQVDDIALKEKRSRTRLLNTWIKEKIQEITEGKKNENLVLMAKVFQEVARRYGPSLPQDSNGQTFIPGSDQEAEKPCPELMLIQWHLNHG